MAASIAALPTTAHNNSLNNNGGGNNMSEKAAKQSEQCSSNSDSEMMSISLQMEEPTNNEMTSTTENNSIVEEASSIELQPIITISGSFTDGNSVSTMRVTPNQTKTCFKSKSVLNLFSLAAGVCLGCVFVFDNTSTSHTGFFFSFSFKALCLLFLPWS